MSYIKGDFLYEGKVKTVYAVTNEPNLVWLEFKNSLTAFNAQKTGQMDDKGKINLKITEIIFNYLKRHDIKTHWVQKISDTELVCTKVEVIPLEVVVRNQVDGSLAKKFDIKEGTPLKSPLVEFYYKKDELNDPFISEDQALVFEFVKDASVLTTLKKEALKINELLKVFFSQCGIELIDFKLEFGESHDRQILLADEISPDSCRLWDQASGERMDKDRFRRDLGQVKENYEEVLKRIQQKWSES